MTNNTELHGNIYFPFNDQKNTSKGIDKVFRIMNRNIRIRLLTQFCGEIYRCRNLKRLVYILQIYYNKSKMNTFSIHDFSNTHNGFKPVSKICNKTYIIKLTEIN